MLRKTEQERDARVARNVAKSLGRIDGLRLSVGWDARVGREVLTERERRIVRDLDATYGVRDSRKV